jgi:hypothetical protein
MEFIKALLEQHMKDPAQHVYPPEFIGKYTRHQLATGQVVMMSAVGYFPEDVWPRIKNPTTEELQQALTNQQWSTQHSQSFQQP